MSNVKQQADLPLGNRCLAAQKCGREVQDAMVDPQPPLACLQEAA